MEVENRKIALRAVKISLVCVVLCFLFFTISVWILLNQITATTILAKENKELHMQIERLEQKLN